MHVSVFDCYAKRRFGGDSLQGRDHLLRLHPFPVAELGGGDRNIDLVDDA